MARQSGKTMKVDVALPLDIYDVVVKLAEESDAPIHHRSNMRVLSPTILHLIGLGIKSLEDNPELLTLPIATGTDGKIAEVVASLGKLADRITGLEDRLSDKLSNAIADISPDLLAGKAIEDLLSDYVKKSEISKLAVSRTYLEGQLKDHPDRWQFETLEKAVEALGAKLAALTENSTTAQPKPAKQAKSRIDRTGREVLTVAVFKSRYPDKAEIQSLSVAPKQPEGDEALELSGLDAQWVYEGGDRKFISLEVTTND